MGIGPGGSMQGSFAKFQLREVSPTYLVLTCRGDLSWEDRDLLAQQVQEYLDCRPGITGLVLDLGGIESVNSAGLGALFQLNRRLRDRDGRLAFANVPPLLLRVFRAVGLNRLAGVEPSVEAALTWLTQNLATPPVEAATPP